MDQALTSGKTQNRLARELDTRETFARPTAWRPPETLPMPNDRPGWTHRYVRISTMGTADPSNISSKKGLSESLQMILLMSQLLFMKTLLIKFLKKI